MGFRSLVGVDGGLVAPFAAEPILQLEWNVFSTVALAIVIGYLWGAWRLWKVRDAFQTLKPLGWLLIGAAAAGSWFYAGVFLSRSLRAFDVTAVMQFAWVSRLSHMFIVALLFAAAAVGKRVLDENRR